MPGGDGGKGQREAVAKESPRAPDDDRHDGEADHGVEPGPPGVEDHQPGDDHAGRNGGVGGHVQEGALDVDVALGAGGEQPCGDAVHEDADRGHDHHGLAGDRCRLTEALDRLPGDGADRDEQEHRVEQGREDRRALHPVSVARARGTLGQRHGDPGHHEAEHVREIVAGIGQQGDRVREYPVGRLDGDEADVQGDADGERLPEARRGVRVSRSMRMPAMVPMPMVSVVVVVMILWHCRSDLCPE